VFAQTLPTTSSNFVFAADAPNDKMPARVDLPKEMIFGRHEIRLYTFDDLEATGRVALKQRALNLRDMLSDNPHVPRLSPSSSPEQLGAMRRSVERAA